MFKFVQALAGFVVKLYEKEAAKLHAAIQKAEARRAALQAEIDSHDATIASDIDKAVAATDKAAALAKLVK